MGASIPLALVLSTFILAAFKLAGVDPLSGWPWWAVLAPAIAWGVWLIAMAGFFFGVLLLFWRRMD